jgi:hypothetical protein
VPTADSGAVAVGCAPAGVGLAGMATPLLDLVNRRDQREGLPPLASTVLPFCGAAAGVWLTVGMCGATSVVVGFRVGDVPPGHGSTGHVGQQVEPPNRWEQDDLQVQGQGLHGAGRQLHLPHRRLHSEGLPQQGPQLLQAQGEPHSAVAQPLQSGAPVGGAAVDETGPVAGVGVAETAVGRAGGAAVPLPVNWAGGDCCGDRVLMAGRAWVGL